jgi:hypothetical protein
MQEGGMTAALLEGPVSERLELDGGATLEVLLNAVLREVRSNGSAECPVCHAHLSFTRAGAREAECGGCGSRLS